MHPPFLATGEAEFGQLDFPEGSMYAMEANRFEAVFCAGVLVDLQIARAPDVQDGSV